MRPRRDGQLSVPYDELLEQFHEMESLLLGRLAQNPLVSASTYITHDSVLQRIETKLNARLHEDNLASAKNISWRFSGLYLDRAAMDNGAKKEQIGSQ